MKKLFVFILSVFLVVSFGCSALTSIGQDKELFVKAVAAQVLYNNPSWAAEANRIASDLLAVSEDVKAFSEFQELAFSEVAKLDLAPATREYANGFVVAVFAGLNEEFERLSLPESERLAKFVELLKWFQEMTNG